MNKKCVGEHPGFKFNVGQMVWVGDEYDDYGDGRVVERAVLSCSGGPQSMYKIKFHRFGETFDRNQELISEKSHWFEGILNRYVEEETMTPFDQFKNKHKLNGGGVLLFPFGSRVYGTADERSDYDFMAIVPDSHHLKTGEELRTQDFNVHVYTRADFQEQLGLHKVHTLEAYFLPDGRCKKEFPWKLDLSKLRHELSAKSSNSWVKAKKKMEVEKDFRTGKKSLFHALRILVFGTQIAKDGKITDYSAANHYWHDIAQEGDDWETYKEKYQQEYNRLATVFRELAPK